MQPRQLTILLIVSTLAILLVTFAVLVIKVSSENKIRPNEPVDSLQQTEEKVDKIHTFKIIAPAKAKVGEQITISVIAVDNKKVAVPGYTGIILIKSNLINMPKRNRFLPGDLGRHKFKVKATAPGTEIIEITDSGTNIKAKSRPIVIEEDLSTPEVVPVPL